MAETEYVIRQRDEHVAAAVADIPPESLERQFEVRTVNIRGVVLFAIALFVAIFIISLVLWWMLQAWSDRTLRPQPQILPAQPTVQPAPGAFPVVAPVAELQAVVGAAQAKLNRYGWVDQKAGIVHIPIDQAMKLLVQRGLPAQNGQPPNFDLNAAHQLDSEGGQEVGSDFATR